MRRRTVSRGRQLGDAELVAAVTEAGLDGAPRDGRRAELEAFLAGLGCSPVDWLKARAAVRLAGSTATLSAWVRRRACRPE